MDILIKGYVDKDTTTQEELIAKAITMVEGLDYYESKSNEVLSKLYYISPILGIIIVAISEEDKNILKVDDQILAITNINEYPLSKLPSQLLVYKEVIINKESLYTLEEALNIAQAITDENDKSIMPEKITITKVIDYRNDDPSTLVMNTIFGDNIFLSTDATLVNNGDVDSGLNNILGIFYQDETYNFIPIDVTPYYENGNRIKISFTLYGDGLTDDDTNKHFISATDTTLNDYNAMLYFESSDSIHPVNTDADLTYTKSGLDADNYVDFFEGIEDGIDFVLELTPFSEFVLINNIGIESNNTAYTTIANAHIEGLSIEIV